MQEKMNILKNIIENFLEKNVKAGIDLGIIRKDADPEFLMQFTTGTYFHTLIKYDLNNTSSDVDISEKEIEGLRKNLKFIFKAYLKYGIQ